MKRERKLSALHDTVSKWVALEVTPYFLVALRFYRWGEGFSMESGFPCDVLATGRWKSMTGLWLQAWAFRHWCRFQSCASFEKGHTRATARAGYGSGSRIVGWFSLLTAGLNSMIWRHVNTAGVPEVEILCNTAGVLDWLQAQPLLEQKRWGGIQRSLRSTMAR